MLNIEKQEYYDNLTVKSLIESATPLNATLRERRKELGLDQQQLAELVGFGRGTSISHYETLRYFPNSEIAGKIAEVLGVSSQELFPEWLKEFNMSQSKIPYLKMEVLEADMNPQELKRAIKIAEKFEPNFTVEDPHITAEISELGEKLEQILDSLTKRERWVLKLRSGLADGKSYTLEEVGDEFGITREAIRRIEAKALRRLRHPSRAKKVIEFLDEKPGDLRNPRALMNGAINAFYQGDYERVRNNFTESEKKILSGSYASENTVEIISHISKYPDSYKWSPEKIEQFVQLYKRRESFCLADIYESLPIVEKLREVWKLRANLLKL